MNQDFPQGLSCGVWRRDMIPPRNFVNQRPIDHRPDFDHHDHQPGQLAGQPGASPVASSTLSSIVSILQSAGLTGTNLASAVSTIAASSPNAAVQANLTAILSNSGNPKVVADLITKLAEIPNLPTAVANLLPSLEAAQNPMDVVKAVQAMETALGAGGLSLWHW
jgi:hypothetical protein